MRPRDFLVKLQFYLSVIQEIKDAECARIGRTGNDRNVCQ